MGCWGITAMESDTGLDAIGFISRNLPVNGKVSLDEMIEALQNDSWNRPPEPTWGQKHTSLMAVVELMVMFLDKDVKSLDYEEEEDTEYKKFGSVHSFTASKKAVQYLRDYLAKTLQCAREEAEVRKWGGWFEEVNWIGWQEHMEALTGRLDSLLMTGEDSLELVQEPYKEKEQDRKRKEKALFLPEDGMTVTFSVIMLCGRSREGKSLHEEIYIGGSIDSRHISNLPDFRKFEKKCDPEGLISVDNYAYELEGENGHTREARKEEIEKIIGQDFPFNYDAGILHSVNHEGPYQFYIRDGEMYSDGRNEAITGISLNP